jgi:D-inositol-3-phosphate glycosyltransferase
VGSVAVISLHTSPLALPGIGDSGGMNVYVRELAGALGQAGVDVRVYTRRWSEELPDRVPVEPGVEVVHVPAGPVDATKEQLPGLVDAFADGVARDLAARPADVLHANYWLSAVAGHTLKHRLELPLVSTFHTLARVKADAGDVEPGSRVRAETTVIGCCDAICASNTVEAGQLVELYGADPTRIEIVPPGVDRAFFSPGDRAGARSALGLDDRPTVLFVGRIQPLKGPLIAVEALARLRDPRARLVVVGGPSGPEGALEWDRTRAAVRDLALTDRTTFVDPQPHHVLSTYYRAADVVVVPSRSESFGLVALEAAACGIPVVGAAVGGLRTLVEHGHTGFLVEGRDPADFAARIDELIAQPGRAAAMGRAAAELASGFSWSTTAGRLRRLYADLGARRTVECR